MERGQIREKILNKITKKMKKGDDIFKLSDRGINYESQGMDLDAKNASFLFESGNKRYSIKIKNGEITESTSNKIFIIPFIKRRVAVVEWDDNGNAAGISYSDGVNDDKIKLLGYMDFGTPCVFLYLNSDTATPLIRIEEWNGSGEAKLLYQAFHKLLLEKGKEGEEDET